MAWIPNFLTARGGFDLREQSWNSLDPELLRRLAQRFGRDAERTVEDLIGTAD